MTLLLALVLAYALGVGTPLVLAALLLRKWANG